MTRRTHATPQQADNVFMQNEVGRMFADRERARKPAGKPSRPQLATLGQCLEDVARGERNGFTKITTHFPEEHFEPPRVLVEAATAANLDCSPITIFIRRGTSAAAGIALLNAAVEWLQKHGNKLSDYTPDGFDETLPF